MQKSTFVFLALLLMLTSTNCKKNNGGNTPAAADTYQPSTTGSEWNYTTTGTGAGSFKITATSTDTTINSRTYRICTNTGGQNTYYCKSGNDYYRYGRFAELNNEPLELLYLKDNLATGQSWTETKIVNATVTGYGTVPVTAVFVFTVAEKGTTHVVGSTTFSNVIKVTAVPSFSAFSSSIPVASYTLEYYYAKNIGLIHSVTAMSIPLASVNFNAETKLGAYTIK